MADIEITVDGGTSKRLLTAGKYCDRNITVTATGGGGGEPEPPDDGKTRLYITVPANSMPDRLPPRNEVPLYINQSVANGVTIDWGDDSEPETLPGTDEVNAIHTYQQAGDYIITLEPIDGCTFGFGNPSAYNLMASENSMYPSVLHGMRMGNGITRLEQSAFYDYASLSFVIISNEIASISDSAFNSCTALYSVVIPKSVISIERSAFYYCTALSSVIISDGVTSIGASAFDACFALSSIVIPESVTSIGERAFSGCYFMKEYHFLSKVPPTLADANVFEEIFPDCIIYVPVGSLEAYQTATNWSTYADQMQEEPA